MADKHTYTVNRAMHGDGKDYVRGDTRELTETDAAALVATGALSLKGKEPVEREPAVRHTFGTEPSAVNEGGYTTAIGEGVSVNRAPATKPAAKSK
jgi:hypothetical protein